MKIIHRIGVSPDNKQRRILEDIGIKLPVSKSSLVNSVTIELDEESDEYKKLQPYIYKWQLFDGVGTVFTNDDFQSASSLVLISPWINGYPMPDMDGGYKSTTYKEEDYCNKCGGGLIQQQPFRLKKEPNWGNKLMFSLNWIFDEVFVKRDFFEEVLKKYGLEAQPVLLYKKDAIIENTVQLKIPITDNALLLDGYEFVICDLCQRKRYDLIKRGFFPTSSSCINDCHLYKSKEDFGTGANTRKYIIVSQTLRQVLVKSNIKANYIPMGSVFN